MNKPQYFVVLILTLGVMATMASVRNHDSVGMEKSRASSSSSDGVARQREVEEQDRDDSRQEDRQEAAREGQRMRDINKADETRELHARSQQSEERPDDVELRDRIEVEDSMGENEDEVGGSIYRD